MADPQLTPVIVQDAVTGRVLMLAYADDEALRRTRETGQAWFWSRSRRSSGTRARPRATPWRSRRSATTATATRSSIGCGRTGLPVTPAPSRASRPGSGGSSPSERQPARGSYVAGLLEAGPAGAARKVGEEGVEVALAGVSESDERLVEELADLWFHSYVLLAARGLQPSAVEDELRRRHES